MPRLLKRETDQRLAACQEAITLAFSLLSRPRALGYERSEIDGAIEIGLIGIAAELAISACLYEVLGSSAITRKSSGFYVTASEALESFRSMLSSSVPGVSSLTQGVKDAVAHLKGLNQASVGFGVLFTARAAAIHAGAGTSHAIAFYAGKTVADFLVLLAESPKWRPYLCAVPEVPELPKDRTLIAQELAAAAVNGDTSALIGVFLVLPELTSNEPEWLASLQRVQVTPKTNDITVLIKSLQHGAIGELFKVGKGANAIAAKIDASVSGALTIYPTAFKKAFDHAVDSWGAYVGNANATINKGFLDLPPINAIYSFAAMGIEEIGLPEEDLAQGLSAHVLWPFIASALHYAGTKGPCFFLVRRLKLDEGGQLLALLKKAGEKSTKIKKSLALYLPLFTSLDKDQSAPKSSEFKKYFGDSLAKRLIARDKLPANLAVRASGWKNKDENPYEQIGSSILASGSVGEALHGLCAGTVLLKADLFPILRLLVSAASDREDIAPLIEVLCEKKLDMGWTGARQAIRDIDFYFYGPKGML